MTMPDLITEEPVNAEIRAALARRRKTQTDLAETLGLTQASVSDRLLGKTDWRLSELRAVAELLRVPLANLVPERTEPVERSA